MNKKYLKILGLVVIIIGAYLYLSHAYIFYEIKTAGLKSSDREQTYLIGANNNAEKKVVYIALGDSLTAGVGVASYQDSYPYVLAKKLVGNKDEITLKNFSYPGARTADLIKDLLTAAIAQNPGVVTLLVGTNDVFGNISADVFKKNYQNILERLTKETKAEIYAISIPFIGSDTLLLPPYNYYYKNKIIKFNKIIKELADFYNIRYIDIANPTAAEFKKNGSHYAADRFHPSAIGYKEWSEIIYGDISQ
jgi:lysophospholipase L1-like esterase